MCFTYQHSLTSVKAWGALGAQQAFGAGNATVQVRCRLVVGAESNVVPTAIVDVGASFKQTRVPRHSPKTLQWTNVSPHGGAQTTEGGLRVRISIVSSGMNRSSMNSSSMNRSSMNSSSMNSSSMNCSSTLNTLIHVQMDIQTEKNALNKEHQ